MLEVSDSTLYALFDFNRKLRVQGGVVETSRIEPRLTRIASHRIGLPVEVRCWSRADWPTVVEEWGIWTQSNLSAASTGGFADVRAGRIHLPWDTCRILARLSYGAVRPVSGPKIFDLAVATTALAHEAEHLANLDASEATVQCYAVQDVRDVVFAMTHDARYAGAIAKMAWLDYFAGDDDYRTPLCRKNGPLDRAPEGPSWP